MKRLLGFKRGRYRQALEKTPPFVVPLNLCDRVAQCRDAVASGA